MRSRFDRIRHAVCFEIIGLILLVGVLSQLGYNSGHIGAIGVLFSLLATGWNYIYNVCFDRWMRHRYHTLDKTVVLRVIHSVCFEAGLLLVTIPILAWTLHMSLWDALVLDMGMVIFYLVYAYVYNWVYDKVCPVPNVAHP